ncbi:GPALPP motifs-containing protein 1-like [Asterias rubens]|uniref:GPALPP motifs-containing protein 1-like n=1 Tax=Asterias rubens TaxID=7604 RepID=UPI0014559DBA|nr:GPALPP motifs-containing protein 1-like [Asterias rubens]
MSDSWIGPMLPPSIARDRRGIGGESPQGNIGPTLPPHFKSSSEQNLLGSGEFIERGIGPMPPGNSNSNLNNEDIGPSLPPNLRRGQAQEGPSLPPRSLQRDSESDSGTEETYGPSLPPAYSKPDHILGPTLPPGFRRPWEDAPESDEDSEEDSSEEEVIGPMPASEYDYRQGKSAAEELEARAAAMKDKLTQKDEDVAQSRDSWMTELPEFSKSFGMGPRTFRKNARPDEKDRSGWTETPADRAKKEQERMERAVAAEQAMASSSKSSRKKKKDKKEIKMSERDRGMAETVQKHNERARAESLMDIHSKNRKRKMAEQGTSENERRPFDRENDLQVNRFDDARRKQLLKKSAHLGEKFSHSTDKVYL